MWRSATDPDSAIAVPLQIALERSLRDTKGPYWTRFSERSGEELIAAIHEFTPTVIVFEKMEVVPYLELTRTVFNGPVVIDLDEVSGPLNRSLVSQTTDVEERFTRRIWSQLIERYEAQIVPSFDRIWVSSQAEALNFKRTYGDSTGVSVVHNSIDLNSYDTGPFERIPKRIVSTGSFNYSPNLEAVHFLVES